MKKSCLSSSCICTLPHSLPLKPSPLATTSQSRATTTHCCLGCELLGGRQSAPCPFRWGEVGRWLGSVLVYAKMRRSARGQTKQAQRDRCCTGESQTRSQFQQAIDGRTSPPASQRAASLGGKAPSAVYNFLRVRIPRRRVESGCRGAPRRAR